MTLVQDQEVRLPVAIRVASLASATYAVPAASAQDLIAYSELPVLRAPGGRALCTIAAVDYRDGDLGAYHEVAVAFLVRPPGRPVGAFIHRLPVDQTFTLEAGVGIWGFPKFLTDCALVDDGRRVRCDLAEGGRHILELTVHRSPLPLPGRRLTMDAWSWRDGVLRRTPWVMTHRQVAGRVGGAALRLGHDHPMAEELRSLGLPRRALFSSTVGQVTGSFEAPEVIKA